MSNLKAMFIRVIAVFFVVVFVPFFMTVVINRKNKDVTPVVSSLDTNRDVIIKEDNSNRLIDVEEYIFMVLPGVVEPNCTMEYIEAQAVAVRTNIYFAMGENTLIDAKELPYTQYKKDDYIKKWGEENYAEIKKRYEQAVINTVGETVE